MHEDSGEKRIKKTMSTGQSQALPSMLRIWSMRRLTGSMVDIVLASIFINLLGLALPIVILQVYDRIVPNAATGTLALLLSGLSIALLFETLLRLARSFISAWVGARFEHIVGGIAMERLLKASLPEFERDGSGVHLERLEGLNILKEFYSGQALIALFDLPFAVLFLGIVWYLAGPLVLVSLALILTFGIGALITGRQLRRAVSARSRADEHRFNFIIEILGGIHTVKAMAMEPQMLRRYERLQEASAENDFQVTARSAAAMGIGAIFSYLSLFATAGIGSIFVIDGDLTIGGLSACTLLTGRAIQPLQRVMGLWTRFQTVHLARERLRHVFALEVERASDLPDLPEDLEPRLTLAGVGFRYGENLPEILTGIDLEVAKGEAIGISGGNASGKTTLLHVIMGILAPTTGEVRMGGHDFKEFNPQSIYRKIAYLPQQGVLFNGTILDNITMFRPELIHSAVDVARLLGLDEIVSRMPFGYDTVVGDGAHDFLPQGIRQRLAIARALAPKPHLILFDEANMAIDSEGDRRLRDLLEQLKGRCTMVLVTRRPSLLKLADTVYEIAGGRLRRREADGVAPSRPKAPLLVPVKPR